MKKSKSIKALASALVKAQKDLSHAKQDKVNPFYKSKYADLSTVIDCTKEALHAHGLAVTQGNEVTETGVVVTTLLVHESGEWIESRLRLPLSKDDPQGVGGAITYGRRYALSAIAGISSEEDTDGHFEVAKQVFTSNSKCSECGAPAGKPHGSNCTNRA